MLDAFNLLVKLSCNAFRPAIADSALELLLLNENNFLVQYVIVGPVLINGVNQIWEDSRNVLADHSDCRMSIVFNVFLEVFNDFKRDILVLQHHQRFFMAVVVIDQCVVNCNQVCESQPFDWSS